MKKWTSIICIASLMITLLCGYSLPASAVETSGKCGDNLTWEYDQSYDCMVISGSGPMYDYSEENRPPWYEYPKSYRYFVIEEGVTSVGAYAFYDCFGKKDVILPTSVTTIGKMAFAECGYSNVTPSLCVTFLGNPSEIAEDAFLNSYGQCDTVNLREDAMQNYGGTLAWYPLEVTLNMEKSNLLIGLNEELTSEDVVLEYKLRRTGVTKRFTPQVFSTTACDHSIYGEKNTIITADGFQFPFTYFITDGSNHFDLINVSFPSRFPKDSPGYSSATVVKLGSMQLEEWVDYRSSSTLDKNTRTYKLTIKGQGIIEGYEQDFYYPALNTNIANLSWWDIADQPFQGMPLNPNIGYAGGGFINDNDNFVIFYENNINEGTATAHIVGTGTAYGHKAMDFDITRIYTEKQLNASLLGYADEELHDNIYVEEVIIPPAKFQFYTSANGIHKATYELYRLSNDKMVLVTKKTTPFSDRNTGFSYDFSNIYKGSVKTGGEIYVLSYTWIDHYGGVYAGMLYMLIPAEVPQATSMTITRVDDKDYQWEYLYVTGNDGALDDVQWTSSNTSIAEVDGGIVSMKNPGTATITAKCGNLVASQTVSASLQDLSEGMIFDYIEGVGAQVIWDHRALKEGTDYTMTVTKDENGVNVTATGIGWFTGELMKTFSGMEHLLIPDPHTHSFDNSCDSTCNGCDFTRDRDHTFSTEWSKDLENHYHECTACGEKADVSEHTLTGNGKECTVCGRLWIPGDIDGNGTVNRDDVIALLLHVSMPAAFPISIPADYNGDGQVTRDDVIQLLLHVSMPDAFPLNS